MNRTQEHRPENSFKVRSRHEVLNPRLSVSRRRTIREASELAGRTEHWQSCCLFSMSEEFAEEHFDKSALNE